MSTANNMFSPGPFGSPGGNEMEKSGVRLGIALAASLGLNFLLVIAAGKIAENMDVRPASDAEQAMTITMRPHAATPTPLATPVATPKPAIATPVPVATATPRPIPTPRPERRPLERATPRAIPTPVATPRPVATPADIPTPAPATAAVARAEAAPRRAFANPTERAVPRRGNTASQPAVRAASARIEAGGAAPAARAAEATARRTANPAAAPLGSGPTAINNSTALAQPNVTAPLTVPTRQLTTSGGIAAPASGRTAVVTMSARGAAASVSPTDFTIPAAGTIRSGVPVPRQGSSNVANLATVAGTPTILNSAQEAEVNAPPTGERRLLGIRGAKLAPRGSTISAMSQRTGGADIQAGIAPAGGSANGEAGGAGGGGAARGVATRGGGQAEGRGGALSAVNGNGAGVSGDGVGSGSGRGQAGVRGSTGNGGRVIGSTKVGGTAGGPRAGSGNGDVQGVPDGVIGGSVKTGGTSVRTNGNGRATEKAGDGPTAVASQNGVKASDDVVKAGDKKALKVKTTDETEDSQIDGRATQVAAQIAGRPEFDIPDDLRRAKIAGASVRVRVTIESSGRHSEELLDGTGNSDLDRAVMSWLRSWRWDPAKQDGKPVRSTTTRKVSLNQD